MERAAGVGLGEQSAGGEKHWEMAWPWLNRGFGTVGGVGTGVPPAPTPALLRLFVPINILARKRLS